jgi:hypothetical protein
MHRHLRPAATLSGALAAVLLAAPAGAQQGAGSTGATVLQLTPGSRAAALSGAYTSATGDADVVFYNPAGLASLRTGASFSYERFVEDIALGSLSGAFRAGSLSIGAGLAYLNAGSVREVIPDPIFGGERGNETGNTVSESEAAGRLSASLPLREGRLRLGAGAGFVSSSIAGETSSAPIFDLGAQASVSSALGVGAALRNLGGSLSGDAGRLPSEARLGATFQAGGAGGLGFLVAADYVQRLKEKTGGLVAGVEAGLLPGGASRFGAVGRVGYSTDQSDGGLGPLEIGGGISLGALALDYTYRNLDFFGAVHRFGVRWSRPLVR